MKMKMLRKTFFIVLAFLAMAACNRETFQVESTASSSGHEGDLTFKASFAPASRSHFNNADDGTANAGTLYWDGTEKVGIISLLQYSGTGEHWYDTYSQWINSNFEEISGAIRSDYKTAYATAGVSGALVNAPVTKYFASSVASVSVDGYDSRRATLKAPVSKRYWFANDDEVEDPYYQFIAIYPMSIAPELRVMYWEIVEEENHDEVVVGIPVRIADEQDVREYADYQVCVDMGYDLSNPSSYIGCYSKADLLADGSQTVTFDEFIPVTAMLRFGISTDYSGTESKVIDHIIVSSTAADAPLAGSAYVGAYGPNTFIYPDRWSGAGSYQIRLNNISFDAAHPSGNWYCMSLIPSYKSMTWNEAPMACNRNGGEDLVFRAYSGDGELLFETTKQMPENGFLPGRRYDFTLNLVAPGSLSLEADAGNAGEYTEKEW